MISTIDKLAEQVIATHRMHNGPQLFTVAISGIDASGKGYITRLLEEQLEKSGYRVANINIDPWQTPIPVRLNQENPAENLYNNIFRWEDFFRQLILPLKIHKNIRLDAELIRTDADRYYSYTYEYNDLDILLLEGILLFKEEYFKYYDLKVWIDCSFETGLQRALRRNVEKLDEPRLIHDYDTFYYAAQRLHLEKDLPILRADIIFDNDK